MFKIDKDKTINVNRGDSFSLDIKANDENYIFQIGDVIKLRVYERKGYEKDPVLEVSYTVTTAGTTQTIGVPQILFGEDINKPKTYWYEISVNEDATIVGYDEDGPKLFIVYPADETRAINNPNYSGSITGTIYPRGGQGIGTESIIQTSTSHEDDGINVITATLTNGETFTFNIKNGSKGSTGETGPQGEQGPKGETGNDGYTPIRGVDYFTDADKQELESNILEEITPSITQNTQDIADIKQEQTVQNNNITNLQTNKANANNVYTKAETDTFLINKVDKATGMGLSSNDFTNEYKQQITTNQTNIQTLQSNVQTNANDIASLEEDVSTNTADIATAKSNISTLQTNVATNTTNITKNAQDITDMKEDIATNTSDISTLSGRATTNEQNIATNTANISENAQDIEDIQDEQTTQNESIAENASNIQANADTITELLNNIPTGQAHDTSIDLTDSAEMRVKSMQVGGNSVQDGEPTPNSPVEVHSCGEDVNIFDISTILPNIYINTDGTTGASQNSNLSDYIPVKGNQSYTLSYKYETLLDSNNRGVVFYDDNKTRVDGTNYVITNKKYTFTPNQDGFIRFCYDKNCYDIKLQEGSIATPYSPYDMGSVSVEMANKNYLNTEKNATSNAVGITAITDNEGIITLNGTTSSNAYIKVYNDLKINLLAYAAGWEKKKLKAGTYTISTNLFSAINSLAVHLLVRTSAQGGQTLIQITSIGNAKTRSGSFTLEEDTEVVIYLYVNNGVSLTNMQFSIQLEQGSTATDCTPHQSQTYTIPVSEPMRKIGDYEDTYVKKDGKWYFKKAISTFTLTGNESDSSFYCIRNAGGIYRLSFTAIQNLGIKKPSNTSTVTNWILSNYFTFGLTEDQMWNTQTVGKMTIAATRGLMFTMDTSIDSISAFKTWLQEKYNSGNPVFVDYALETPTETEVTNQATIDALEEIYNNAKTYKNVTHIYSEDEVSPNVTVVYRKDIETMFNNLTSAVVALGGDINV